MIRSLLLLLLAVSVLNAQAAAGAVVTPPPPANVTDVLKNRTVLLQKFASLRDKGNCSALTGTVGITLKYGREGNLWMQYLNLIWLAKYLNRMPVISSNDKIFKHFDMRHLHSSFCIADNAMRRGVRGKHNHLDIRANEIHGPYHLYKKYAAQLPPQKSAEALESAADDMLFFFAAIYAGLKQPMVDMLAAYITKHFQASFNYVVIQKRNYEGSCCWILYRYCQYSDFSSDQFDMTTDEWKQYYATDQSLGRFRLNNTFWRPPYVSDPAAPPRPSYHPLCNMTAGLVQGAVRTQLHMSTPPLSNTDTHRDRDRDTEAETETGIAPPLHYFLMSDQQQPVAPEVTATLRPTLYSGPEATLMDRLIATHSRLFIRNSASSFSLSSDVVRRILSLPLSGLADNSSADYFFGDWFSYQNLTTVAHRRKQEFASLLLSEEQEAR